MVGNMDDMKIPHPQKRIYLDSAATNLVDDTVLDTAARFAALYRDTSLTTADVFHQQKASLGEARKAVARLLGCDATEIALMQSTSHALGTLSTVLPLEKGDNVLVCDLEYQASVVCWQAAMDRVGFELRQVTTKNGVVTPDDFAACIDEHTKVILLAAVQEINGFRADVKAIGELAHAHNCLFIVDGIQEAGALSVNVKELGMDFYCAGGKKWLGNPFGMGFLYIRKELLESLKPPYYSYYDIQVPEEFGDYLSYLEDPRRHPFDKYHLVKEASVFETGGYGNFLGAQALGQAIAVLEKQGIAAIEEHNLELSRYLYQELSAMGLNLQSSGERRHMSSIVVFNIDGLPNQSVEKERRLLQYLRDQNIFVTLRCSTGIGGIRVSFHYYTQKQDIDVLLDAVKTFLNALKA